MTIRQSFRRTWRGGIESLHPRCARQHNRRGAIYHLQLVEDIRNMVASGLQADRKTLGDLLVDQVVGEQLKDFDFAVGQFGEIVGWGNGLAFGKKISSCAGPSQNQRSLHRGPPPCTARNTSTLRNPPCDESRGYKQRPINRAICCHTVSPIYRALLPSKGISSPCVLWYFKTLR